MTLNLLTDRRIQSIKQPGNYADGGNLYLRVRSTGSKSFILKATVDRRQREWTIGPYGYQRHQFTLAKARQIRDEMMEKILSGLPPRPTPLVEETPQEALKEASTPAFGEFALDLLAQIESGFRNKVHRAQWRSTLLNYCKPIWDKPVDAVNTDDILSILQPIWMTKSETASRLRGRIERVLNAAKVRGHRSGENPAAWHGHLEMLLQRRAKLQRGHHPALPFEDLPAFWRDLSEISSTSADGLRFLILTAARSGETRGATWDEIDWDAKLWRVPANRMKAGKEHVVPLAPAALRLLERLHETRCSALVFPGQRDGRPLSDMTLAKVLQGLRQGVTVHGFRSSFRDWCGDRTDFAREHAEACLAHSVGSAVERAYRRSNSLERRRRIMETWENFILTGKSPLDDMQQQRFSDDDI